MPPTNTAQLRVRHRSRLKDLSLRSAAAAAPLFSNPSTWFSDWNAAGPETITRIVDLTAAETGPVMANYFADSIHVTNRATVSVEDFDPDMSPYYGGPESMDVAATAAAAPKHVNERLQNGVGITEAVAVEARRWQSFLSTEPDRLSRLVTQQMTTAQENNLWKGWQRLPEPGACQFCLALASRGNIYTTGAVSSALDYHANCRCDAVPIMDDNFARMNKNYFTSLWKTDIRENGKVTMYPTGTRSG